LTEPGIDNGPGPDASRGLVAGDRIPWKAGAVAFPHPLHNEQHDSRVIVAF